MAANRARRVLRWSGWALLGTALAIQFIRPERENPPHDPAHSILARAQVPEDVQAVLRRACFDCHTGTTRWPWYSQVAPVSWWLADHVRHARGAMNLSSWPDPASSTGRMSAAYNLQEMCEEVRAGRMPLPSYRLLHPGARLTKDEIDLICRWTRAEAARLGGS